VLRPGLPCWADFPQPCPLGEPKVFQLKISLRDWRAWRQVLVPSEFSLGWVLVPACTAGAGDGPVEDFNEEFDEQDTVPCDRERINRQLIRLRASLAGEELLSQG